ncbi:MAG: hypothetical protein RIQ94_1237 [Pseudomonadota bacterium]
MAADAIENEKTTRGLSLQSSGAGYQLAGRRWLCQGERWFSAVTDGKAN